MTLLSIALGNGLDFGSKFGYNNEKPKSSAIVSLIHCKLMFGEYSCAEVIVTADETLRGSRKGLTQEHLKTSTDEGDDSSRTCGFKRSDKQET